MTSRSDLTKLVKVQNRAVKYAERDLQRFLSKVDMTTPELVRDALLHVMPGLVDKYGNVAATAAAEWYEATRAASIGGSFSTVLGSGASADKVAEDTRWAVDGLFIGDLADAKSRLARVLGIGIKQAARNTISWNSERDYKKPRFARVPFGVKTCAWCSMLASRGFVYRSAESAGSVARSFHGDCDCQIVASWKPGDQGITGYDPDLLYSRYKSARDKLRSEYPDAKLTDEAIASVMREMFPGVFTDSYVVKK